MRRKKKTFLSNFDTVNEVDKMVRGAVNRLLLSYFVNKQDREDLYQKVWVSILELHNKEDIAKRAHSSALITFINGIAHNVIRNEITKITRYQAMLAEIPETSSPIIDFYSMDDIYTFLDACPGITAKERTIYLDKVMNDMTYDTVGKKHNISGRTVKRICQRITRRIRKEF